MNRRAAIFFSLGAVILLLAVIWWWNRPGLTPHAPLAATPTPASSPSPDQPTNTPLTYVVPSNGAYQGMSDPRWEWWREMRERDSKFEWKMPVNFYGKVIDQDSQPVQGAKVRFQWTDMSAAGTTEKFTGTDAQGSFSLTNEKGKRLGVYVSKDGYHALNQGRASFEYAAFFDPNYIEPDPDAPVIFQLLKKIDAEPLIVGDALKKISYDRTYYYDLQRGTLSQQPPNGAGLKFTLMRSQAAQGQPFDWTWTVEGVNAAVQATADEFTQIAPNDGYMPSWKIEQKSDAENFQRQAQVRLYLRTGDNRYGRVDLELSHPNAREVGPNLSAKSYFNPSGSRNLEFDPAKVVQSP